MRIKEGFVLRKVGKEQVVVAIGPAAALLNGLIKLNASGVMLWNQLEQNTQRSELVDALLERYDITREQAEADVDTFLKPLLDIGAVTE